jgi:hypothetical protein
MGWMIEDNIIKALRNDKLTTRQVKKNLEVVGEFVTYGTVSHHLRKMHKVQQLYREKGSNGQYVYWNCIQDNEWPDDLRDTRQIRICVRI